MTQKLVRLVIVSLAITVTLLQAKTDNQEVSALNVMFTSLNSPSKLKGWKANGGDPCEDSWEGVKCKGSSVTELQLSGFELGGSRGYLLSNLKSLTTFTVISAKTISKETYLINSHPTLPICKFIHFNLGQNKLNGELPDMFQKLSKLETL
ncbi:Contains similarity to Cf-2.2 gene gb/U42445 from Solanum pimpinellifolium [Arabidopsis thaliana]|nr:Contains similarity to Cf-2.2 gene gb/U42445 from Solanum pimpinellifolium [Arabidopsis thaliana]